MSDLKRAIRRMMLIVNTIVNDGCSNKESQSFVGKAADRYSLVPKTSSTPKPSGSLRTPNRRRVPSQTNEWE